MSAQAESVAAAFDGLLARVVAERASDLHLAAGKPPLLRVHGELRASGAEAWPADAFAELFAHLLDAARLARFGHDGSIDFGHTAASGERFRVAAFRTLGAPALVARHLPNHFASLAQLHLPEALEALAQLRSGLVLVTGVTGSGKSTTLATLVHAINRACARHIVTIEDPVEFVHEPLLSRVSHRELGGDTPDFAFAVRAALREDPDVIMVGELRDTETMRAALVAAETGHLVFSTLHTGDAVGAIERFVGAFPGDEQAFARQRLSLVLRAAVSQQLVANAAGDGRVPAVEILRATPAVANLIATARSHQIYSAIETGSEAGMQTFDQSLAGLARAGLVCSEQARLLARDAATFDRLRERDAEPPARRRRHGV